MVSVGEDIILFGQEGSSRVHKIDARQFVLQSNFLSAQVLLYRDGEVGAALVGEVVDEHHALLAVNLANASNNVARRHAILMTGQLADFQERRTSVAKFVNALTWEQLTDFLKLLQSSFGEVDCFLDVLIQLVVQLSHRVVVGEVRVILNEGLVECFHEAAVVMRELVCLHLFELIVEVVVDRPLGSLKQSTQPLLNANRFN